MSCGTCPDSAQPTTRKDGVSPMQSRVQWGTNVGDWYRQQRAQGSAPVVVGVTEPPFALPNTPEEAAPVLAEKLGQLTGDAIEVKTLALEGQGTWLFIAPHSGLSAEQHASLVQLGLPRGATNGMQDRQGRRSLVGLSPQEWPGWITRLQSMQEARRMLQYHPDLAELAHSADEWVFYAGGARATLLVRRGEQLTYYQLTPAPDSKLTAITPDLADLEGGAAAEIHRVRQNGVGWLLCIHCGGPLEAGECLRCGTEAD